MYVYTVVMYVRIVYLYAYTVTHAYQLVCMSISVGMGVKGHRGWGRCVYLPLYKIDRIRPVYSTPYTKLNRSRVSRYSNEECTTRICNKERSY